MSWTSLLPQGWLLTDWANRKEAISTGASGPSSSDRAQTLLTFLYSFFLQMTRAHFDWLAKNRIEHNRLSLLQIKVKSCCSLFYKESKTLLLKQHWHQILEVACSKLWCERLRVGIQQQCTIYCNTNIEGSFDRVGSCSADLFSCCQTMKSDCLDGFKSTPVGLGCVDLVDNLKHVNLLIGIKIVLMS